MGPVLGSCWARAGAPLGLDRESMEDLPMGVAARHAYCSLKDH